MSHSKFEVEVNSPKHVTVDTKLTSVPPLSVLTLNLITVPNHNTNQNEVCILNDSYSIIIRTKFFVNKCFMNFGKLLT